jgi:hypothetical protein
VITKQNIIFLFFFAIVQMFVFAGGKAEPFTKKVKTNFTVDELKQGNYLLKDALILTRVVPYDTNRSVDGGTLSVVNGERVETITIPTNAIGKLISVDSNSVKISFSPNHADRILSFSEKLIGNEYFLVTRRSIVKYGQYDYKVNREPKLLVQFTEQFIRDKTTEKETGW